MKFCKDCHWPVEHIKHDEIHPRLKRWSHTLHGVRMSLCRPWQDWGQSWQAQLEVMLIADQAELASKGWKLTVYHVDNYNAERESIRHWFEAVRA